MNNRREREQAILAIVRGSAIHTQGELVQALRGRGFDVTQATASRDIKRLGLVKLPDTGGAARYALPASTVPAGEAALEDLRRAVRESVTGIESGEVLLAVSTPPGHANVVAEAIDRVQIPGVVGTIAGDDTIFLLLREAADRDRIQGYLEGLV